MWVEAEGKAEGGRGDRGRARESKRQTDRQRHRETDTHREERWGERGRERWMEGERTNETKINFLFFIYQGNGISKS